MNAYVRAVMVGLGTFLGGVTAAYNLNPGAKPIALVMAGAASLVPYLIGLSQRQPWDASQPK